jgi:hypothetical protein
MRAGGVLQGRLNILNSGYVAAADVVIGGASTINLDGGTLQVASVSIASNLNFNWTSGTLAFTGDANVGNGLLPKGTVLGTDNTLGADKTLSVGNNLTGKALNLDGGTLQFSNPAAIRFTVMIHLLAMLC